MKKHLSIALLFASTLMASGQTQIHWSYGGTEGPEFWGKLSEKYSMCTQGQNQSPVNITDLTEADMETLKLDYSALAKDFVNNGHTVQVNFPQGSTLTIDEKEFTLKQFHFHTPSENHINGKSYPMEAHLVHANQTGALAVIAIMLTEGKENPFFKTLVANLPQQAKEHKDISKTQLNAIDMLPKDKDYYRFSGSLTTPPCSEGVRWIVLKNAVEISKESLAAFSNVMGKNNRPIQAINAREILQ
ncbi:MAG: carbonic anhydrase family protein [Epsilonproteobacteria bacterium]|nr:carbonic anhydrase family protein [Campylobacterota bacterium]